jgi:GH15 family glucan-1,4-alpha-glucosidase
MPDAMPPGNGVRAEGESAQAPAYAPPIEEYGLIGDCMTAALVSRDGSIDWLCMPRFDSGACFAALLGTPDHGRWRIAPETREGAPAPKVTRRYRPGTLILETEFETEDGRVAVIDFMPPTEGPSSIVRIVEGRAGRVAMRMDMALRFDYGASVPWVTRLPEHDGLRAIVGPDQMTLRTPVNLRGEAFTSVATFVVEKGRRVPFVLSHAASHLPAPAPLDAEAELTATAKYWSDWNDRCTYEGEWREAVCRSLLTLKALTYAPTGGIVAAPTTSVPEKLGGPRNWDYRFCWLRDATITLLAMMHGGYTDEAKVWRDWLRRSVAGSPAQMQIMYGLAGERRLDEWEVSWLPGYQGAAPVRIGNAASSQVQLDVYGELMDALYQARRNGLSAAEDGWQLQCALLAHLEDIWDQPDEGIWEVRGGPRHFTFSKVCAWIAFDRAVRTVEEFGMEGPLDHWRALRDRIHADVCEQGFDTEVGAFVQSYGSKGLDASLLLIPIVGFLPIEDERVAGTIAAIERTLLQDGLVLRYETSSGADGLPAGEGVFLACSFWLVDCYALQGRTEEAHALFRRLVGLANDLGLLSEEYDPRSKRLLGNFPQAFSHVALINTAYNLTGHGEPHARRCD